MMDNCSLRISIVLVCIVNCVKVQKTHYRQTEHHVNIVFQMLAFGFTALLIEAGQSDSQQPRQNGNGGGGGNTWYANLNQPPADVVMDEMAGGDHDFYNYQKYVHQCL